MSPWQAAAGLGDSRARHRRAHDVVRAVAVHAEGRAAPFREDLVMHAVERLRVVLEVAGLAEILEPRAEGRLVLRRKRGVRHFGLRRMAARAALPRAVDGLLEDVPRHVERLLLAARERDRLVLFAVAAQAGFDFFVARRRGLGPQGRGPGQRDQEKTENALPDRLQGRASSVKLKARRFRHNNQDALAWGDSKGGAWGSPFAESPVSSVEKPSARATRRCSAS